MYDANLVDLYRPTYARIEELVAQGVADPEELAYDQTADGSPVWHYTSHTVKLEPLSGDNVRITNGISSYKTENVVLPIEPVAPVVARIINFLGATRSYD